jgi:hypothetical protein
MLTERDKMFGDGEELTEAQKHQKQIVEEILESLIEDIEAGRIHHLQKKNYSFTVRKPNTFSLVWEYK